MLLNILFILTFAISFAPLILLAPISRSIKDFDIFDEDLRKMSAEEFLEKARMIGLLIAKATSLLLASLSGLAASAAILWAALLN